MSELSTIDPAEFEDSMEKSMLFFLASEMQALTVAGQEKQIRIGNCVPFDEITKVNKADMIAVDMRFKSVADEAFSIGGLIDNFPLTVRNITDEEEWRRAMYRYDIRIVLDAYCGSSIERAKIDGTIRNLLMGIKMGYKDCPVYEWTTDTSGVTAQNTGSYITVPEYGTKAIHSDNTQNSEYLTHWEFNAKCLYVQDLEVDIITGFELQVVINNLL